MSLKREVKTCLVLVGLVGLIGCGDDSSVTAPSLDGKDYAVVADSGLDKDSARLSGTGSVVFADALNGVSSNHSYALNFTLEDLGSLTLHSHGSVTGEGAYEVTMTRSGNTLSVIAKKGIEEADYSSLFSNVDASTTISLQIDVHGEEEPAHVLVWTGSSFEEDDAVLNTEDATPSSPGNGEGQYWGLTLSNASVESAVLSANKFSEEE